MDHSKPAILHLSRCLASTVWDSKVTIETIQIKMLHFYLSFGLHKINWCNLRVINNVSKKVALDFLPSGYQVHLRICKTITANKLLNFDQRLLDYLVENKGKLFVTLSSGSIPHLIWLLIVENVITILYQISFDDERYELIRGYWIIQTMYATVRFQAFEVSHLMSVVPSLFTQRLIRWT